MSRDGKVAGLTYLDAGYQYAYYDPSKGFLKIEVNEVRRKLEQLEAGKRPPDLRPLLDELLLESTRIGGDVAEDSRTL
jgi:hypothetical protein